MSGRPWLIAVTVDGVNLPRFLRRAGEMGLLLTGVRIRGKHLSAFAREDDVPPLRMMAENGGWRFSVGNRQGTGRLMTWIRHRLALLSALMLGIGALIGASQVMWRVEIEKRRDLRRGFARIPAGAGHYPADAKKRRADRAIAGFARMALPGNGVGGVRLAGDDAADSRGGRRASGNALVRDGRGGRGRRAGRHRR